MKDKIVAWLAANWQGILAGGLCAALAFGSVGYGCGYIKGCNAKKSKQEVAK